MPRSRGDDHGVPGDERLRAVGEMAVGVAHGLNNLLGAIVAQSAQLLDDPDPERARAARAIHQAASDGAVAVRRLLRVGRGDSAAELAVADRAAAEPLDLGAVLRDAAAVAQPRLDAAARRGAPIDLRVEPARPSWPTVLGVGPDLREAVVNLVVNAVEAMPSGGTIRLRAEADAGHAIILCEDTGAGMSPEVRARIFDRFFTTKGDQGTGVGLALVAETVARHGGEVDVASTLGRGTSFRITLPTVPLIASDELAEATSAPTDGSDTGLTMPGEEGDQALSILVVDDDERFRAAFTRLLAVDGHAVTAAADAAAALTALDAASGSPSRGPAWDLVCVDEQLPDMAGTELARQVRERQPACFIALVSGFAAEADDAALRTPWIDAVLPKPARDAELEAVIQAAQARRQDSP
jgi:CheY-like chemotaxis protein